MRFFLDVGKVIVICQQRHWKQNKYFAAKKADFWLIQLSASFESLKRARASTVTISRAHDIQDFELLASDDQAVLEQLIGDRDIPAPPDDDETNSRSSAATIKPNSATRPRGRAKKKQAAPPVQPKFYLFLSSGKTWLTAPLFRRRLM